MGFFPDYTPLILMDHEPAWRIPIPLTANAVRSVKSRG